MAQRSFKLPDELDATLAARAAVEDRSVSYVIVRALEQALDIPDGHGARVARVAAPEGTRPSADLGVARGQSKEEPKASVSAPARTSEGTPIPKIAPRHWAR